MSAPVHILATVRKAELLDAALLVFKTLRVGFLDAPVHVWGNALPRDAEQAVAAACARAAAQFTNLPPTVHDAWIEELIEESLRPFWICDTDVVFWSPLTLPPSGTPFSGRFEPTFEDEWTGTLHVARLHTAVMYIDPKALRIVLRRVRAEIPAPWGHTAGFPFVRQHFIPRRNATTLCYDTMAGAYQAGLGTAFSEENNNAFEHLYCATYADSVNPEMAAMHRAVYAEPEKARGLSVNQTAYYESRKSKGELCLTTRE